MHRAVSGIVPVMLTPFLDDGTVDFEGLDRLTDWYLANGADALFAVCQSSEMQFLSLEEKGRRSHSVVVRRVAGRVPIMASGHTAGTAVEQLEGADVGGEHRHRCPCVWSPTAWIRMAPGEPRPFDRASTGCSAALPAAMGRSDFMSARHPFAVCCSDGSTGRRRRDPSRFIVAQGRQLRPGAVG